MKNSADERLNKSAAYDLQRITQAAQAWVKDNYSALSQNASSLTPEELKNNHYLPETFPVKNSYGQQYKLQVTPEKSGKNTFVRVTVITHDGMAISISDMRKIAGNMGENSGYSQQNGVITGNQNGWSLPYSEIKRGRVASVSYIAENDVVSAGAFCAAQK
ncbi:shufflon system plasmid conjugative transfer pilus tip adhesin PilV [Apirhabdus apintestini]|nr:shufflon system plasmid conjugative transfer pilus tip adhesin PilV [Enterobacteriaceae bacterium CA-0114]